MLWRKAETQINMWIKQGTDAFLVTGARQIGKTYLIRRCLEQSDYSSVEFNFIENPDLVTLFDSSHSAEELLFRLSGFTGKKLQKEKTIFFLDEIQECKDIVTKIKFLVEEGSYRYILSGSLLGVELNDLRSAPVGYMQILDMYPLDLQEFYTAVGLQENVLERVRECYEKKIPVDVFVHQKLMDAFYLYLIVGGMPEAVSVYLEENDINQVSRVHEKIIRLYKLDFTKYESKYKLKLREIYDAIPGELDEKNKRFFVNHLGTGMSYNRVYNDFLWLKDAGVALPVYNVTEPKTPLIISEKRNLFKLFLSDVGLLTSRYSNNTKFALLKKDKSINNGALFENVVAEELVSKGFRVYYYNSKKMGELDFVIEHNGEILPIEVKSGKNYKRHSALDNVLSNFNYDIDSAYILYDENVQIKDKRIYFPIYMMMFIQEKELDNSIYRIDLSAL